MHCGNNSHHRSNENLLRKSEVPSVNIPHPFSSIGVVGVRRPRVEEPGGGEADEERGIFRLDPVEHLCLLYGLKGSQHCEISKVLISTPRSIQTETKINIENKTGLIQ